MLSGQVVVCWQRRRHTPYGGGHRCCGDNSGGGAMTFEDTGMDTDTSTEDITRTDNARGAGADGTNEADTMSSDGNTGADGTNTSGDTPKSTARSEGIASVDEDNTASMGAEENTSMDADSGERMINDTAGDDTAALGGGGSRCTAARGVL